MPDKLRRHSVRAPARPRTPRRDLARGRHVVGRGYQRAEPEAQPKGLQSIRLAPKRGARGVRTMRRSSAGCWAWAGAWAAASLSLCGELQPAAAESACQMDGAMVPEPIRATDGGPPSDGEAMASALRDCERARSIKQPFRRRPTQSLHSPRGVWATRRPRVWCRSAPSAPARAPGPAPGPAPASARPGSGGRGRG